MRRLAFATILVGLSALSTLPLIAGNNDSSSNWTYVSSPSPSNIENYFYSVAAISANDVWAVGIIGSQKTSSIIEHWDGTSWSLIPHPNPGTASFCHTSPYADTELLGLAPISTNDVWAVGEICGGYGSSFSIPFTEHWDGSKWTAVAVPSPQGTTVRLTSARAFATNDVWAVGYYYTYSNGTAPFAEHWDGSKWILFSMPGVAGNNGNYVYAVAGTSTTDLWAVGETVRDIYSISTLIEHWNGTNWSIVSSPSPGEYYNALNAVTVISANDAWAVGSQAGNFGPYPVLTEHWDGVSWTAVPGAPLQQYASLDGTVALASNDVWAVGINEGNAGNSAQPLAEHWDGTAWTLDATPDPGKAAQLFSVSAASGQLWAVGAYSRKGYQGGNGLEQPLTFAISRPDN